MDKVYEIDKTHELFDNKTRKDNIIYLSSSDLKVSKFLGKFAFGLWPLGIGDWFSVLGR